MTKSIDATSFYPPALRDIDTTSPIFFWIPTVGENGFLGQFCPSKFVEPETHPTHVFTHAEQYMMYHKALLLVGRSPYFTHEQQSDAPETSHSTVPRVDPDLPDQVLRCEKPDQMKRLVSPRVINFSASQLANWENIKFDVVCRGSRCKFGQSRRRKKLLLDTGLRELVEASKYDTIWGIGFDSANAMNHREAWGKNMLGNALMLVRQELAAEQ